MKKTLKIFLILPLLVFSMFFLFACGEDSVKSVSISLPSVSNIVEDKGRYYLEFSNTPLSLDVSLSPSKFSTRNITWLTSASNVAYVYDGKLVMVGEGDVNIQAEYVNEDGSSIFSSVIKLNISKERLPFFAQPSISTTYAGRDVKDDFSVQNAKEIYEYVYYKIDGDVNGNGRQVSEIIDVGEYLITYVKKQTQTKYAEMTLNVSKYAIVKTAPNCSSVYSESLPEGFFTTTPTSQNFRNGPEIKDGIGIDAGKTIGWYLYRTSANALSTVGSYPTSVVFEFDENYAKNYTSISHSGTHTITPKKVILAVDNQEITYGEAPLSNVYSLYNKSALEGKYDFLEDLSLEDLSLEGLTPLSDAKLKLSINPGNYVFSKNGIVTAKNEWRYIDAGTYSFTYNASMLSTDDNVEVDLNYIFSGTLTVRKRAVTITPHINSKVYTEADDLAALKYSPTLSFPEIQPFLVIDYKGNDEGESEMDYGEKNFCAPAGMYFYDLNNSINTNFDFLLTPAARSNYVGSEPIQFEVKKCPVVVHFNDIVSYYKTPLGYDEDNKPVPTVSYYSLMASGASPNYQLNSFSSMTINGVEQVVDGGLLCAADEFEDTGLFVFSTEETFRIRLKLKEESKASNHFATFSVGLYDSDSEIPRNYEVDVKKSFVHLDKIDIKVIPKETSSKEYSGDISMPSSFYYDYETDGEIESGVSITSIFGTNLLLSLTDKDGLFHKLNADNTFTQMDNMIDCGKYKIFLLSTLRYTSGKEYYNFSLDSSRNYLFTVNKGKITIIPDIDQSKVYGNSDPILTYTYGSSISNLPITGRLSRETGENVGTYTIGLGTLSFGDNFILSLSTTERKFAITKREITITPISYITTFGDSFPSSIGYNDPLIGQTYNQNILVRPTFSGEFRLEYDGERIEKAGNFYPVKIVGNEVVSYVIKKGEFNCSDPNYDMTVTETSTYLVNKKEATLNFVAENKTSTTDIQTTINDFSNYSIDSEDGRENVSLSEISITITPSDEKYLVSSISDISSLSILLDGTDITDCYDLTLGSNVIYYIANTIIDLAIVAKEDPDSSVIRKTFSGEPYINLFEIVSLSPEFEVVSTNHHITYSTTNGEESNPTNAGSYFVSLDVNDSNKIILRKSNNEQIEFSFLEQKVDGCVLNLSQYAYLNIARAEINCAQQEYLVFEKSLTYGSDEASLPKIKTNYIDNGTTKYVFTGVDGQSEIELKTFEDGKNFTFFSSPQSVRTLSVSSLSYSIKVIIQPEDSNYNSRLIDVKLTISPKVIELESSLSLEYKGNYQDDGEIVYSGHASIFALKVETPTDSAVYSNSYTYKKLDTFYENDVHGYVKKYNYNSSTESVESTDDKKFIADLTFSTIELILYGGEWYYLLNKNTPESFCVLVALQDATPKDAGIYLCDATCTAGENFVFAEGTTLSHYSIFEIVRASNIAIKDWQSTFRYGTRFDLSEPFSLPFEYSMEPNFKSKVQYSVLDQSDWGNINFILPVSSYEIILTIDEPNYYLSSPQSFSVIRREVEIVFPERVKYGFKGENEPVNLFLDDLYAILKDHNGNPFESRRYSENELDFELTYLKEDVTLQEAPYEAGNYTLIVKYDSSDGNYYGEGEFNYSIEKQAFSGDIKINNKEIEYNSSYSAAILYEQILQMFKIEEGYNYTLIVKDEGGNILSNPNDSSWLSIVNKEGTHQITFIVEFFEDNFSSYEGSSTLTITPKKITDSNFIFPSNNEQYSYTGNYIYNQLFFSGTVDLSPKAEEGETLTFPVGSATYYVQTIAYNKVKVMDSMQNDIFTLIYNYYEESTTNPGTFNAMNSIPLSSKDVDYKVEYVFSDFGKNYSNRLNSSTITRYFKINKLSTLYISIFDTDSSTFDTDLVREYVGENYRDILNLVSLIGVSNNAMEKDNIKKKMIRASLSAPNYSSIDGVHLVVFYTNADGVFINDLTSAGDYFLNISFLRAGAYAVSEFFEYVVFNGGIPYKTSEYFTMNNAAFKDENFVNYSFIYQTHFSIPFTIEQVDCPHNAMNIDEIMLKSQGDYSIIIEQSGLISTTILQFSSDYKFTLKDGSPFTIVFETYVQGSYFPVTDIIFKDAGGYYLSNFVAGAEYSFKFVDPNGNYKDSEHIRFRVAAE